jgi:hypothetical protein
MKSTYQGALDWMIDRIDVLDDLDLKRHEYIELMEHIAVEVLRRAKAAREQEATKHG